MRNTGWTIPQGELHEAGGRIEAALGVCLHEVVGAVIVAAAGLFRFGAKGRDDGVGEQSLTLLERNHCSENLLLAHRKSRQWNLLPRFRIRQQRQHITVRTDPAGAIAWEIRIGRFPGCGD
jgi:hypothetical protein